MIDFLLNCVSFSKTQNIYSCYWYYTRFTLKRFHHQWMSKKFIPTKYCLPNFISFLFQQKVAGWTSLFDRVSCFCNVGTFKPTRCETGLLLLMSISSSSQCWWATIIPLCWSNSASFVCWCNQPAWLPITGEQEFTHVISHLLQPVDQDYLWQITC